MATRKKGSTGKGKGRGKAASGAPRIDAKSLYSGTHSLGEQATRWLEERRKTGGEQQDINLELEEKACKCINDFEKSNDNLFRFRSSIIRKYDGENEKTPAFRTAGDEVAQLERMAREGSVLASCFVAERMLWDLTENTFLDKLDKADTEKKEKLLALLDVAASGGLSFAYALLYRTYCELGDSKAELFWFEKSMQEHLDVVVLDAGDSLLCPVQVSQEKTSEILEGLYALALDHSWDALAILARIRKYRAYNETVTSFTKHRSLIQSLINQMDGKGMRLFAEAFDGCEFLSPRLIADARVTRFYEQAAMLGDMDAMFGAVEAQFVGSHYTGLVSKDELLLESMLQLPGLDEALRARILGLLGRLLRYQEDPKGDELLLEAARTGYPEALCRTILMEFLWGDDDIEYREDTLLDDQSLDDVPAVLFARGRMHILFSHREDAAKRAVKNIAEAAQKGDRDAKCWLADALIRGLFGIKQDTGKGFAILDSLLQDEMHPHPHPRVLALEAIRQLGWIRGLRGKGEQNRAWAKELFGWAASQKDPLGYAGLVLLKSMEAGKMKQQKEMGTELAKVILYARSSGDASALFLLGAELCMNNEDPDLNAVCKYAMKEQGMDDSFGKDLYCAQMATSLLHSAGLIGEPQGEILANLPDPFLGNLERFRKNRSAWEDFF